MMAQLTVPVRWVPGLVRLARSDSLVRNSLYLMTSTVITAGLGYVFWIIAAHAFTRQEVGIGGAVISLCSAVALLTFLGPQAMLIENLPRREYTPAWNTTLSRMCLATAGVTALVTIAIVPVLLASNNYRLFFNSAAPILLTVAGAVAWTLVNLFSAAFVAARRAGRLLTIQALVSAAKVLFIVPLAVVGAGSAGVVGAWVVSAVVGVGAGIFWLVPGMRLGRRSDYQSRRRGVRAPQRQQELRSNGRHRRSRDLFGVVYARRLLGQHLTSVGGALTPLLMPVLVAVRLGVTLNAYFYITWMLGSIFFMVSPAVATALFAEGVRAHSDLGHVVTKSLRVIGVIMAPAILFAIVGGRFILCLFGISYAAAGYGLLVLLALSALPDAVSNVAVAVLRVTHRLRYSAVLNIGILVITLVGAWLLMPSLGILAVGVTWLGAQTLGAIASLPVLLGTRKR